MTDVVKIWAPEPEYNSEELSRYLNTNGFFRKDTVLLARLSEQFKNNRPTSPSEDSYKDYPCVAAPESPKEEFCTSDVEQLNASYDSTKAPNGDGMGLELLSETKAVIKNPDSFCTVMSTSSDDEKSRKPDDYSTPIIRHPHLHKLKTALENANMRMGALFGHIFGKQY